MISKLFEYLDSQNYAKELDNRQREQDLKEVLETWKRTSVDQFKQRVLEKQISLTSEWNENLIKPSITQTNLSQNTELIGDVLCRACGYFLGQLAQVRRYEDLYFINDHDFYNRIEEKSFEPEEYRTSSVTGTALCGSKNCRAKLGRIQVLKDYPKLSPVYPLKCAAIKIKQIKKDSGKETFILPKNWSKLQYKIPVFEIRCIDDEDDEFYDAL